MSVEFHPNDVEVELEGVSETIPGSKLSLQGNFVYTKTAPSKYYVWCTASRYTYREIDDFDADSVLWMRNVDEFSKRLLEAAKHSLPTFQHFGVPVAYVDPLHMDPSKEDVFRMKHFKFAYQNEYRFYSIPVEPGMDLAAIFLDLGPLSDISNLQRL